MNHPPRVLIVQPNMQPPGGAQSVSAWAAMALQNEYKVDLFTWVPFEAREVNRFYGTALDATKLRNFAAPRWLRRVVALDPDPWSYQRLAFMSRLVKLTRWRYDLVLSFCDEVDLGAPAIQYIHYPYMGDLYRRERKAMAAGRRQVWSLKLRPWRLISGFSFERMRNNIVVVNSDWTGAHFANAYDKPWRKIYPAVPGNFPAVPWHARENAFVCIGRISGEKRFGDIVEILKQVRARGHAVRLHIVGATMGRPIDMAYYVEMHKLVKEHSDWLTLHENIGRAELERLVVQTRYGIHAMRDEHFGIAPAELVRAGCIVFLFNDGGQVEIVGQQERLRYNSNAEAVEKICAVLTDEVAQTQLCTALAGRADLFSPERFMSEMRDLVNETLLSPSQPTEHTVHPKIALQ